MKAGKIPESILSRAILKQIRSVREEILEGPGIGCDYSAVCLPEQETLVLSTNPVKGEVEQLGRYAAITAANHIMVSGAEPVGLLVDLLLPEGTKEAVLRRVIQDMEETCKRYSMDIIGGHTEVTNAVNRPILSVTGVGRVCKDRRLSVRNIQPGLELVMTKWAGILGTSIAARSQEQELLQRYPLEFVQEAKELDRYLSVAEEAAIARSCEIRAMHDISRGGVFGALWEVAAACKVGLEIDLSRIPLRQETVEVCEFLDWNPYRLDGTGSLLIACTRGSDVVDRLHTASISAVVIGRTTDNNDKVIINEEERSFLEPPKSDELNKIFSIKQA